eukprot:TRINITY_DN9962_c0_g1_i18.p1 TRINITY_DN9962_c0_g1~~TRINITY_DN9962_c0_g1_i18.p1  ORF type:complete len:375 (+),score=63.09 TRINITY_DN9962_c0_g1_i18:80-1204(+)
MGDWLPEGVTTAAQNAKEFLTDVQQDVKKWWAPQEAAVAKVWKEVEEVLPVDQTINRWIEPEVFTMSNSPFFFREGFMPTRTAFEFAGETTLPMRYAPYVRARLSTHVMRSVSFLGEVGHPLLVDKSRTKVSASATIKSIWMRGRIRADGSSQFRFDGPLIFQGRRVSVQGYISNDSSFERVRIAVGAKHTFKDFKFITNLGLCARDGPYIDNITQYKKPHEPMRLLLEPTFSFFHLRFVRLRLVFGWFDRKTEFYGFQDYNPQKQRNTAGVCCVLKGRDGLGWVSCVVRDMRTEVQGGGVLKLSPSSQALFMLTTNGQVTVQTKLKLFEDMTLIASFNDRLLNSRIKPHILQRLGISLIFSPDGLFSQGARSF